MKNNKIFSPNDLYNNYVMNHSFFSTYKNKDFDSFKLSLLDHLFNVIGNGINSNEDFLNFIYDNGFRCTAEDVFKKLNGKYYSGYCNDDFSKYYSMIPEEELKNYSNHNFKIVEKNSFFSPYPNFKKEYSVVYNIDFDSLGENKELWINEIIYFYQSCINFLNSDDSKKHNYAYPSDNENKDKFTFSEYQRRFETYLSNEEISKAYGLHYDGNLHEFICNRWKKEKEEWIDFSEKTISFLKSKL